MKRRQPYEWLKRPFDLVVCVVALPAVLLIGLACAVAIRLDSPGPVLFSQDRTGRDGQRFRIWKFRTMVENAEELKSQLAHLNVLPPPDFKIPNDPRVTRVGRVLRRTSLDELPQLYSVLKGDMSLVGPRPTTFAVDAYALWHTARLDVMPGLTGLWQIGARHAVSFDERLRLDIAYIERRSFLLDLRILLSTVSSVVLGKGA